MSDRLNAALNVCLLRPLLLAVLTLAFSILVCSAADQVGSGTVESDVLTSLAAMPTSPVLVPSVALALLVALVPTVVLVPSAV